LRGAPEALRKTLEEQAMTIRMKILVPALLAALCVPAHAVEIHAVAAARALARVQADPMLAHAGANDGFVTRDVIVDRNGDQHVRFDRTYRGLRVIGGDLVVHTAVGGVSGVSMTLVKPIELSIVPTLPSQEAIVRAGVEFGSGFEGLPTANLVVYARHGDQRLAWEVLFSGTRADRTPTRMRYYVDANTGAILAHWDTIETDVPVVGTGHTLQSGSVQLGTQKNSRGYFEMKDPTRGGSWTSDMGNGARGNGTGTGIEFVDADDVWGNFAKTDRASVAADAHFGIGQTWDYYKNVHGRLGVANDGVGALARVHYLQNYANAFWSDDCFCMTFGDGDGVTTNPFTAIDVTGHEMSHGVTSHTANLDYEGESGGLNEANSDMMGTMVEYYANNPANPPNYLIGEKLFIDNPGTYALRSMFKPSLDGISPDCYPTDPDYLAFFKNGLDVHYVSGVANHFYYLLAEGSVVPATNGFGLTPSDLICRGPSTLKGIGRDAASKIWFRALTVYMTSGTDYHAARAATLSAATDLYGATSRQYRAVVAAWYAVRVR
jgi:Zn-dependent metalloprotease